MARDPDKWAKVISDEITRCVAEETTKVKKRLATAEAAAAKDREAAKSLRAELDERQALLTETQKRVGQEADKRRELDLTLKALQKTVGPMTKADEALVEIRWMFWKDKATKHAIAELLAKAGYWHLDYDRFEALGLVKPTAAEEKKAKAEAKKS